MKPFRIEVSQDDLDELVALVRKYQARLNEFPQFVTTMGRQTIHFLHVRSPERDATPLLLVHSTPGSFVEFLDVIEPLADPRMYGGDPTRAFDVVVPSIPGHGISVPVIDGPWTPARVLDCFADLMSELGYRDFVVDGAVPRAGGDSPLAELRRGDADRFAEVCVSWFAGYGR